MGEIAIWRGSAKQYLSVDIWGRWYGDGDIIPYHGYAAGAYLRDLPLVPSIGARYIVGKWFGSGEFMVGRGSGHNVALPGYLASKSCHRSGHYKNMISLCVYYPQRDGWLREAQSGKMPVWQRCRKIPQVLLILAKLQCLAKRIVEQMTAREINILM